MAVGTTQRKFRVSDRVEILHGRRSGQFGTICEAEKKSAFPKGLPTVRVWPDGEPRENGCIYVTDELRLIGD